MDKRVKFIILCVVFLAIVGGFSGYSFMQGKTERLEKLLSKASADVSNMRYDLFVLKSSYDSLEQEYKNAVSARNDYEKKWINELDKPPKTVEMSINSNTPSVPRDTPTHRANLNNFYINPNTNSQIYINWGSPLYFTKVTSGISMQPYFGKDTLVMYQKVAYREIKAGDIIVYENSLGSVVHRVIGIEEDADGWYAETQGDNNSMEDIFVIREAQLKGVVIGMFW